MLELAVLKKKAVDLLCQLIETQSFSSEEDKTAELIMVLRLIVRTTMFGVFIQILMRTKKLFY